MLHLKLKLTELGNFELQDYHQFFVSEHRCVAPRFEESDTNC